ncbi:hypothetical protein [Dactylosporangium darangshiense]|uniref:Core-binding (CB) domain-containing protein n=1 Tax=Dactylosporangium darangshiense TaxID=579108 RepID=A0ABP8DN65_9ACTN
MAALPIPGVASPSELVLRAATAANLGRYRGQSRLHCESELRVVQRWCLDQDLDPLNAVRVDIERYVRWLQDLRCYQPSTVSRRLSILVGFYRVCAIDGILPHSPADYVRRRRTAAGAHRSGRSSLAARWTPGWRQRPGSGDGEGPRRRTCPCPTSPLRRTPARPLC